MSLTPAQYRDAANTLKKRWAASWRRTVRPDPDFRNGYFYAIHGLELLGAHDGTRICRHCNTRQPVDKLELHGKNWRCKDARPTP